MEIIFIIAAHSFNDNTSGIRVEELWNKFVGLLGISPSSIEEPVIDFFIHKDNHKFRFVIFSFGFVSNDLGHIFERWNLGSRKLVSGLCIGQTFTINYDCLRDLFIIVLEIAFCPLNKHIFKILHRN